MKYWNLILMAIILAPSAGWAADATNGKVSVGVQGGLTFPNLKIENQTAASVYDSKTGWLAGVFAEIGIWTITLRPEVNYVQKKYTVANAFDLTNRYLEVPVLFKVNPLAGFVVSPFVLIGPQWSWHLDSKVDAANTSLTYTNSLDRSDFSGILGAGIEFNVSENVGFNVQGRYNFGFRDLDSSSVNVKSRGWYAIAGFNWQNAF